MSDVALTPEEQDRERRLKWFRAARYGMFIHFGMSTFVGDELPDGNAPATTYARRSVSAASMMEEWALPLIGTARGTSS
jgi:hypothetical protein